CEHGRIQSDADGQRQHHCQGKRAGAAKLPQRITQVLNPESNHGFSPGAKGSTRISRNEISNRSSITTGASSVEDNRFLHNCHNFAHVPVFMLGHGCPLLDAATWCDSTIPSCPDQECGQASHPGGYLTEGSLTESNGSWAVEPR